MIQITKTRDQKKIILTFSGHAGYAEQGKDIVCSAVSALYYALISGTNEDEGLTAIINTESERETGLLLGIEESLRQIADTYPDHVLLLGFERPDSAGRQT